MKRFVWGIVIVALAVVGTIGNIQMGKRVEPAPLILLILGGILLIVFGWKYLQLRKRILEASFQMLRKTDGLNAGEIAATVGASEVKVREILLREQRKGTVPFKYDIK